MPGAATHRRWRLWLIVVLAIGLAAGLVPLSEGAPHLAMSRASADLWSAAGSYLGLAPAASTPGNRAPAATQFGVRRSTLAVTTDPALLAAARDQSGQASRQISSLTCAPLRC
jgi:hypothetical protein